MPQARSQGHNTGDICLIPARGGSKRIPRKNIRPFAGRPIIEWPISVAQSAMCFDRVVVSTDDHEIAATAMAAGAEVPFLRPAHLADDFTVTRAVVCHAIDALRQSGVVVERVCCLYPTAVFVTPDVLLACRHRLETTEYVFPVTRCPVPIERAYRMSENGQLSMNIPEAFATRSQDLADAFFDAGQFYWARAETWLSERNTLDLQVAAHVLPRHLAQDIDTPEDWEFAERLFALDQTLPGTE